MKFVVVRTVRVVGDARNDIQVWVVLCVVDLVMILVRQSAEMPVLGGTVTFIIVLLVVWMLAMQMTFVLILLAVIPARMVCILGLRSMGRMDRLSRLNRCAVVMLYGILMLYIMMSMCLRLVRFAILV